MILQPSESPKIRLYVSITRDLYREREIVGQVVAALPVEIGWSIAYTPPPNVPLDQDALREAMLYVCVIGRDISAPVGAEWERASGSKPTLLYAKGVPPSPSAQDFLRHVRRKMTPFQDTAAFSKRLRRDLAGALLERAGRFGLELHEVEALRQIPEEPDEIADEGGLGAGQGGVIIGRPG